MIILRTVLFLINGFGVESKDSYSVYSEANMPNFDKLAKKYMFAKVKSNVFSTIDGFRNMSLELNELYNYGIYERAALNNKIAANPTVTVINKALIERKCKLHLLCFVDTSTKIVDNLKNFLTLINKERDKQVFIHVILTSKNFQDFPMILEVLSKINIELEGMASIGMVMGLTNLLNSNPITELNFLLRNMISEMGERWSSFKQKLDVSYGTKSAPISVKPFVVNSGFGIKNTDLFMIWNYDNLDISNFIDGVKNINYGPNVANNIAFFSLFPVTYKEKIHSVLNFEIAKNSLATNMKGLGFKTLMLSQTKDVSVINYYYSNYNITKVADVEHLIELYKKIDTVLGAVYDNTQKNSYNIIVTSLYPMNMSLPNASGEICNISCTCEPLVYIDNFITKKGYLLNDGNISDIFKVCYKSLNKDYPGESLVTKKNILYRLVFK